MDDPINISSGNPFAHVRYRESLMTAGGTGPTATRIPESCFPLA